MKIYGLLLILPVAILALSCNGTATTDNHSNQDSAAVAATAEPAPGPAPLSITGTWKLLTGTLVEKGDTSITDYTRALSCIKIITPTHFAFFQHDLRKGQGKAVFASGGGSYTLRENMYTEHLEYCNAREWEGNDFPFTVTVKNDTLVQEGTERVESAGIERFNREVYVRVR